MSNELKKLNPMRLIVSRTPRCDRCGHTEPAVARLVCDEVPDELCPWKFVCADCVDPVLEALGDDFWETTYRLITRGRLTER
jgi:hypothetical protein